MSAVKEGKIMMGLWDWEIWVIRITFQNDKQLWFPVDGRSNIYNTPLKEMTMQWLDGTFHEMKVQLGSSIRCRVGGLMHIIIITLL